MNLLLQATTQPAVDMSTWNPTVVMQMLGMVLTIITAATALVVAIKNKTNIASVQAEAVTAKAKAESAEVATAIANDRMGNVARSVENMNADVKGILKQMPAEPRWMSPPDGFNTPTDRRD